MCVAAESLPMECWCIADVVPLSSVCSRGEREACGEGQDVRDSERDIRGVGPLSCGAGARGTAVEISEADLETKGAQGSEVSDRFQLCHAR